MSPTSEILLTPNRLAKLSAAGHCVVVDCRFDFSSTSKGHNDYLAGHIPGAHYAHLDHDLASSITPLSGRHPLPKPDAFANFLGHIGWKSNQLLVAYDERNNAIASRLWWLMRYFGQNSSLLDGGLEAWKNAHLPLESGPVASEPTEVGELVGNAAMAVSVEDILDDLGGSRLTLIDARAPERFSGETEPLDSRAGHIPGALNRPLGLNLDESGHFKSPELLRLEFETLLQQRPLNSAVHSCGSGVTACHNRFAMELAGLGGSRVYPGSWSEWSRDESRPIEIGN